MRKILVFAAMSLVVHLATAQKYSGRNLPTPEQRLNNEYASGLFKSADGIVFDIEANQAARSYLNILDFLAGRVAGLQIYHQKDGTPIPFIRNQRASIYLDEMPVSAASLSMLSSSDIAMIKVIKGAFAGGVGNGPGGVIAVYTIKSDGEDEEDEATRG